MYCIYTFLRSVWNVVFEAHCFQVTSSGNKKFGKQLWPDYGKFILFDAPNRRYTQSRNEWLHEADIILFLLAQSAGLVWPLTKTSWGRSHGRYVVW